MVAIELEQSSHDAIKEPVIHAARRDTAADPDRLARLFEDQPVAADDVETRQGSGPERRDWTLTGGTGLALQLGHRDSNGLVVSAPRPSGFRSCWIRCGFMAMTGYCKKTPTRSPCVWPGKHTLFRRADPGNAVLRTPGAPAPTEPGGLPPRRRNMAAREGAKISTRTLVTSGAAAPFQALDRRRSDSSRPWKDGREDALEQAQALRTPNAGLQPAAPRPVSSAAAPAPARAGCCRSEPAFRRRRGGRRSRAGCRARGR
mgnify:CR=1 FL=1